MICEYLLSLKKVYLGARRYVTFTFRLRLYVHWEKDGCLIGLHLRWSRKPILHFAIFMRSDAKSKNGRTTRNSMKICARKHSSVYN
jgi:hypothetical protein